MAAPLRNAKGDISILPYRIGTNSSNRPWLDSFSIATGWGRLGAACHSPWLDLGTRSRSAFPIAMPSVRERGCGAKL
ncbi:MAG: hypothetical protein WBA39_15140 [Rivularia sp. (in: cyanobacteria)]